MESEEDSTSNHDEHEQEQLVIKQRLRDVDRKLAEIHIPIGTPLNPLPDPCFLTKTQRERNTFTLKISNEVYVLWEEKISLLRRLSAKPPALVEMLNQSLRDQLIVNRETDAEQRLQMKSSRLTIFHSKHAI